MEDKSTFLKVQFFQTPPFEGSPHLGKKSHFLGAHFSCKWDEQTNFKFEKDSEVLFIYRLIPRKPDFLG
jgi:hypothetical protein